ncbi:hypothetical protein NAPIS_ORF00171 [Vairimorpha apis BRL 01]|uniref:Reverse transcriptase n=1 Tax=Vairimorpha apis BRL 01 TaxID=1037528 RepID=T0MMK9_9MICR|nr:hypothetical protein NAPIS_ORF00171 [Vairimorpha apis BRL 01]
MEPDQFKCIDDDISKRLYLPRNELGRGLNSVELKSEQLFLRRKATLKIESNGNTHLSKIEGFLKCKYNIEGPVTIKLLDEAQKSSLYSDISKKFNHSKLYRIRTDPLISIKESSAWLKHGNMQPREEGALCALQDRNIFLEKGIKCPHCRDKYKSVDHMATQCDRMLSHDYMRRHNEALRCIHLQLCLNYGLTKSKKIRNHSLQETNILTAIYPKQNLIF